MSNEIPFLNPFGNLEIDNVKLNILLNNTLSKENINIFKTIGKSGTEQDFVSYEENYYGYRSKQFTETDDFLAAGCSQTFGLGVHKEFIWPNVLGKKINVEIPNLSIVGGSISSIINNLYAYFKKFGNPKTLLLLLPDPYRMQIPTQRKLITSSHIADEDPKEPNHPYLTYLYLQGNTQSIIEKYKKVPFNLEDIIPADIPFFYSMRSISNLIQYCKISNIKLIFSSHDAAFDSILSKANFENYVSSEENLWEIEGFYGEDPFGYKKFVVTSSKLHQHQHIAEIFEKALNV